MAADTGTPDAIVIKKYANRRLYDTSASAYVTLDHLSRLVREGKDFLVQDAKSGEDITRSVLTQIIFEQENRHDGVLPISFLRQIIKFYGESFQSVLPAYLEMSMNTFVTQQEKWRDHMDRAPADSEDTGAANPFEAQIRRNMQMFEDAMRMFAPFPAETSAHRDAKPPAASHQPSPSEAPSSDDSDPGVAIADLQRQMTEMQRQLSRLADTSPKPKHED